MTEPLTSLHVASTDSPIEVILYNHGLNRYNLNPVYQRSDFVWDTKTKSRLIESILLGLPIGTVYETLQDGRLEPIDGLQRLTTIIGFPANRLKLRDLQFLDNLNGSSFSNLPEEYKERFRAYPVKVLRLPNTFRGQDIRPMLFDRLNAGVAINGSERVMGTHVGQGHTFIKDMAKLLMATRPKDKQRQKRKRGQDDRDTAFAIMAQSLRFSVFQKETGVELGFFSFPLRRGGNEYLDNWNSQVLNYLNKATVEELARLQRGFIRGLEIVQAVFGGCFLTRFGASQRTNTVALIAQFFASTVLDRPLSWWTANREAVLQAYREVSAEDFVPSPGRVDPRRDFLAGQRKLSKILSQLQVDLLKIAQIS